MNKFFALFSFALLLAFLMQGCKTADGRPTKLGKAYLNMTGRYNAYYHAGLRIDKANENIRLQFRDNYNELLPLYRDIANPDTNSVKQETDEAIHKLATNIELRRLSQWTDNSYLLMGQAEFLKHNFEKSAATFKYVIDKYNPDKPKSLMDKDELAEYNKKNKNTKKTNNSNSSKKDDKPAQSQQQAQQKAAKNRKAEAKRIQKARAKQRKEAAKRKKAEAKRKKKAAKRKKKGKSTSSKKKTTNTKVADTKAKDKEPTKKIKAEGKLSLVDNTKEKKEKKEISEDEMLLNEQKRQKQGLLKHKPVRHAAMLWLAKSYIEIKDYNNAGLYLRMLEDDINTPKKLMGEVKATHAHMYIAQKEYQQAIEHLEEAIPLTKRRKGKRARYAYVLAQLYDKTGQTELAHDEYKRVIKLKPSYEMDLNARLSLAKAAAKTGSTDTDPELAMRRMLREDKNEEYKGQIYFTLAEVQLRKGKTEEGIESLQKSMTFSQSEQQRMEASYLLATLYFEREDYLKAYAYFDTTKTTMKPEDVRSAEVNARHGQLKTYAVNAMEYAVNDSLLRISLLPFEEQKALVQQLKKEEEAKAASGKGNKEERQVVRSAITISENALAQSNFPLYNNNQVKKGEKDFEKRWGSRPWTDNWRSQSALSASGALASGGKNDIAPLTEKDVNDYLAKMKVPKDDAGREDLKKKIANNLLNMGTAQHEQLEQSEKAVLVLDTLATRFATYPQAVEGLYIMYSIYQQLGQTAKAQAVKDRINKEHANSAIAQIVNDPSKLNARQEKEKAIATAYENAYKDFQNKAYEASKAKVDAALAAYSAESTPYKPKLGLLGAMNIGALQGEEAYIKALRTVTTSFPETPEAKKAKEILDILVQTSTASKPATNPNASTPIGEKPAGVQFIENMNTGHYVLIVFDDLKTKVEPVRAPIDAFNKDNFSSSRLNVSSIIIENKIPAITVRKFANGEDAINYVKQAKNAPNYMGKEAPKANIYVVGQDNYRLLLQPPFDKFDQYIQFHNNYYKL